MHFGTDLVPAKANATVARLQSPALAVFLPSLRGGGAERVGVMLANGFASCLLPVDLVLSSAEGPYLNEVAANVRIVDLGSPRVSRSVRCLASYLRRERPFALLASQGQANLAAIAAKVIARCDTRVLVTATAVPHNLNTAGLRSRVTAACMYALYRLADRIVVPSAGMRKAVSRSVGVPLRQISVVYNPVFDARFRALANAPCNHPWLQKGQVPVIVAMGRLVPIKGFDLLLQAFRRVTSERPARLLVLGEGRMLPALESLARQLHLEGQVEFSGFVSNPWPVLKRASLYASSSHNESLGNGIVEALALGVPVVATDCDFGPREILDGGAHGLLVPTGDEIALADGIIRALDHPPPQPQEAFLDRFTLSSALKEYAILIGGPVNAALAARDRFGSDSQGSGSYIASISPEESLAP